MPALSTPVVPMLPDSVTVKLSLPFNVWVAVTAVLTTTSVANAGRASAAIRPKTVDQRTKRGWNCCVINSKWKAGAACVVRSIEKGAVAI